MKTTILKIKHVLIIAILVLATSCSKDDDNPEENNGFFMTASIDNDSFNAIPETVLVDYYTDNGDFMTITGKTTENRIITMIVNLQNYTVGSGTYTTQEVNFTFELIDSNGFSSDSWNTNEAGAGNGTLTILEEDNNHLKGTFTFNPFTVWGTLDVYNSSILVTNGSFNAKKI